MEIANKGWKIPTVNDVCHLRKSICFDYEFLNTDHDSSSQNEFYSPTPPRRESDSLSITNVDGLPWHPQRAYALVGSKVITIDNENCPIHFSRDPVVVPANSYRSLVLYAVHLSVLFISLSVFILAHRALVGGSSNNIFARTLCHPKTFSRPPGFPRKFCPHDCP